MTKSDIACSSAASWETPEAGRLLRSKPDQAWRQLNERLGEQGASLTQVSSRRLANNRLMLFAFTVSSLDVTAEGRTEKVE